MIINRLYRYNLTYFLFPGSHKHLIRYQNILFIRIGKESISDYPWNYGCYGEEEFQLPSTIRESTIYSEKWKKRIS